MTMTSLYRASVVSMLFVAGAASAAGATDEPFSTELTALQQEWDAAKFGTTEKHARDAAFTAVVAHATELTAKYPHEVAAVAWKGIVLSTYAGEVSAMSAMKYAKAAREALLRAERMQPDALNGGVYASLGALYSKVPGGFLGFGDDELATEYFRKALAVDPSNIDSNYFYGEFLLDQGEYAEAATVLGRALESPPVAGRPVFDAGRRAEIRELLAVARRKAS
jgi:tetratricopeptide (TPR) repeat protein